jgi:hypothetical protein
VEQRQRMITAQQQSQPDNSNRVIGRMVMKERATHQSRSTLYDTHRKYRTDAAEGDAVPSIGDALAKSGLQRRVVDQRFG